jgi:hypothetical protein
VSTILPVRSTAFLQLAILKSQRVPQAAYLRSLPRASKQLLDGLPVFATKVKRNSVVTSAKIHADFVLLVSHRVREKIAAIPGDQHPPYIQPF